MMGLSVGFLLFLQQGFMSGTRKFTCIFPLLICCLFSLFCFHKSFSHMKGFQDGSSFYLPFSPPPSIMGNFLSITVYPFVCVLSHVWLPLPFDYSPSGSSVHGMFQARILEWVAISSSRGSSQPWDQTHICVEGGFFTADPLGRLFYGASYPWFQGTFSSISLENIPTSPLRIEKG